MVPEQIEQEIVIDAPLEVVWAIVTEPAHVGSWFSDAGAEIDLRPGGEMLLTWQEHGVSHARVERVEPPRLFSFRWARSAGDEPAEGNSTLVALTLSAEGESTRLRVVESGFRALEGPEDEKAKYAAGNTEGWAQELNDLREYATRQAEAPTAR